MTTDREHRSNGTGRLILIVGESGVGKDTLLAAARIALAGDPRFVFPRRMITRPADATEHCITVSETEFDHLAASGAFSLRWSAHGLKYALPICVNSHLGAGRTVVCGVSRTVVGEARQRFAQVTVIEVVAPLPVRAARLVDRGREAAKDIAERLAPTARDVVIGQRDITVANDDTIERAAATFIAALTADRFSTSSH